MRSEKLQMVKEIGEMLNRSSFMYFVSYKGTSVKNFSAFRNELARHKVECHVLKNRLIRKAAEQEGIEALSSLDIKGDTAMIFGQGDAGAVAKVIDKFFKTEEKIAPKSGYLEGAVLSEADIRSIADLPPREVLYSQIIGLVQAPARNLVSLLNNRVSSIVNVINAYKSKLEEGK